MAEELEKGLHTTSSATSIFVSRGSIRGSGIGSGIETGKASDVGLRFAAF